MEKYLFSKQLFVKIDSSTLACTQSFSLNLSKEFSEISCMNSTTKTRIPGIRDWSFSFEALGFETTGKPEGTYGLEEAMANILSTTDPSVSVYYLPDVSLNAYWEGPGYLQNVTITGGIGEPVSYSGEIIAIGDLVRKTTT